MIEIIDTGGSFGKDYGEGKGVDNFTFGPESPAEDMFRRLKYEREYHVNLLMQKDSLRMTPADRDRIADACAQTSSTEIIIIHGTDTMKETARVISSSFSGKAVKPTIVLTGAGRPASMKITDADLQFAYALGVVNLLAPGVYIAMNGQCYPWNECEKGDDGVFRRVG